MGTTAVRELHGDRRSNVPPMLLNLTAMLTAMALLATGWPTTNLLWTMLIILWLAYFHHTFMTIFHEDAHLTLYPQRWHNIFNGIIVGTFLMVPYTVYRQVHMRHHWRMNAPQDWELWPYCHPDASLWFRRIFVVFDLLLGIWVGPFIYGRIYFVRNSPITDPHIRGAIFWQYVLIAVFWLSVLGLVIAMQAWVVFAKVYLIPAFLAGIIQTGRKLTEHLGLPAGDPMSGARTVVNRSLLGRVFSYTSFHIFAHGIHHQYPQMPHRNLAKVLDVKDSARPRLVFPSYPRAIQDMLPHLARPGIGANAAAAVKTASPVPAT